MRASLPFALLTICGLAALRAQQPDREAMRAFAAAIERAPDGGGDADVVAAIPAAWRARLLELGRVLGDEEVDIALEELDGFSVAAVAAAVRVLAGPAANDAEGVLRG